MKKTNYALLVLLALVLASCSAYKQVPYLQASEYLDTSGQNPPLYDARIMPKDLLTITVNTTDPETAAPDWNQDNRKSCCLSDIHQYSCEEP